MPTGATEPPSRRKDMRIPSECRGHLSARVTPLLHLSTVQPLPFACAARRSPASEQCWSFDLSMLFLTNCCVFIGRKDEPSRLTIMLQSSLQMLLAAKLLRRTARCRCAVS